jgi:hypothetical protein
MVSVPNKMSIKIGSKMTGFKISEKDIIEYLSEEEKNYSNEQKADLIRKRKIKKLSKQDLCFLNNLVYNTEFDRTSKYEYYRVWDKIYSLMENLKETMDDCNKEKSDYISKYFIIKTKVFT